MRSVWVSLRRAVLVIWATTALLGCKPEVAPTPLLGKWYSADERFDGRTLEIDRESIRFMQGQQEIDAIRVRAVTQEGSGQGPIHFEIKGIDRDGQGTTLSFEMSLLPTQQLRMETQREPWQRTPRVAGPKTQRVPWRRKPGAPDPGGAV